MASDDWTDKFPVRCLGVDLVIQSADPAVAAGVREAWRDAHVEARVGHAQTVTVGLGLGFDAVGADVESALHHLSPVITQRAIAARSGQLVMLHAAALAHPESGSVAVLIAPSGTGKTTACRILGKRFDYLSDETAGIESDGTVVPYRKPLSILDGGPLKAQVAASTIGLRVGARDWHLAALLMLERSPIHAGAPILTSLHTIDAIAAIAPQSSGLPQTPRALHRLADVIRLAGGAHHVIYKEAESLNGVLGRLLADSP